MGGDGLAGVRSRVVCTLLAALVFSGCPVSKSHEADAGSSRDVDGSAYSNDGGTGGSGGRGNVGGSGGSDANPRCLRVARKLAVGRIDKLDLLLVVDNSSSMAGEQASLRAQFPKLIQTLSSGVRNQDDAEPFPPITDLHVGVVSTDMGIPGVELGNCHAEGGDDGMLQHAPRGESCDPAYPEFLSFIGDARIGSQTDPAKLANDLGCLATLGTGGCEIEQPLEAAFKAVWPKTFVDAQGNVVMNPYRFIATREENSWGRGDQQGNRGFLRNDPAQGQSLLAIVVITDEEDCSVKDTSHLVPNSQLPEDSPYRQQDYNLRCYNNKERLYDLNGRYYRGLRALRPGREEQVVFAVIAGVPADLVDAQARANVDFGSDDPASREAFYAAILSDPRMVERPDPATQPGSGNGNLVPSCTRQTSENTLATAFPPRRLVELARLFGKNGTVQSICQDDFGPAIDNISQLIGSHLRQPCLGRGFERNADGKIACDVIWELPVAALPGAATPTQCDQLPYLAPVDAELMLSDAHGGVSCKVTQLAVTNPSSGYAPAGEGWFYDDFTDQRQLDCRAHEPQRIAFTNAAKPPLGVTVKLACRSPFAQVEGDNPRIGSACEADKDCEVVSENGDVDQSMFCHPTLRLCAKACSEDAQCPRAWTCNSARPDRPFCVHPKCGE